MTCLNQGSDPVHTGCRNEGVWESAPPAQTQTGCRSHCGSHARNTRAPVQEELEKVARSLWRPSSH